MNGDEFDLFLQLEREAAVDLETAERNYAAEAARVRAAGGAWESPLSELDAEIRARKAFMPRPWLNNPGGPHTD